MRAISAANANADSRQPHLIGAHLHVVETPKPKAKYAAVDHNVARILGKKRGAALIYGFLASAWFEYADPAKLAAANAERRKKILPGGWIEVDYRQFMTIVGTTARGSIIRWLRILAEDEHRCPWDDACRKPHPLIVIERQGQSRPNRYRKWRCAEDTRVVRERIHSTALSAAARRRGKNDAFSDEDDAQLRLLDAPPAQCLNPHSDVHFSHHQESQNETSESLKTRLLEVSKRDFLKSQNETSLRGNTDSVGLKYPETAAELSPTAATGLASPKPQERPAAARLAKNDDEEIDDVDAVACEVAEAIHLLAQRTEPNYSLERAWSIARELATAALTHVAGNAEQARALLLHATTDRRLSTASRPIGFLRRGILGNATGADCYLLHATASITQRTSALPTASSQCHRPAAQPVATAHRITNPSPPIAPGLLQALLERLRLDKAVSNAWLRERDITPAMLSYAQSLISQNGPPSTSPTPLVDELERTNPQACKKQLESILDRLECPPMLRGKRTLESPMFRSMCRTRLEAELHELGPPKTDSL